MDQHQTPINSFFSERKDLISLAKYTLFISEEEYKKLTSSPFIKVGNISISINYLKELLSNPRFYTYALRYFNDEAQSFTISYMKDGTIKRSLSYPKVSIIKAFEKAYEQGELNFSALEIQRFHKLKRHISNITFEQKFRSEVLNITIDGQRYNIPIKDIISILKVNKNTFTQICTNPNAITINEIPKFALLYATKVFCEENDIFANFELPSEYSERFEDIKSCKYYDIEALNRHEKTPDVLQDQVNLDPRLVSHILDDMPEDCNDIEKACYIYIKLARTLIYDDEYFATNQKGINTQKHKDVSYVNTITPENNSVVCYEFNLIFAKFLTMLGLNLKSNYTKSHTENYGNVHANLEFRCNKFIVRADATTSILQGDLFRAKVGTRLIGLKCMNKNEQTAEEFKQALVNMYSLIANQELLVSFANNQTPYVNYNDSVNEYRKLVRVLPQISLQDRLKILFNKVNSSGLSGVDNYSYIMSIMSVMFSERERENNIKFTVLSNYEPEEIGKEAMPISVFSVNNIGLDESDEPNSYYIYYPTYKSLVAISKEELQAKFDSGVFSYIPDYHGIIIGICGGKNAR